MAESFTQILKIKINKKLSANDSKSYLRYLNKLVDEYNNTYHDFFGNKRFGADYSAFAEEIE